MHWLRLRKAEIIDDSMLKMLRIIFEKTATM